MYVSRMYARPYSAVSYTLSELPWLRACPSYAVWHLGHPTKVTRLLSYNYDVTLQCAVSRSRQRGAPVQLTETRYRRWSAIAFPTQTQDVCEILHETRVMNSRNKCLQPCVRAHIAEVRQINTVTYGRSKSALEIISGINEF